MSSEVMTRMSRRADALPVWTSVLAVVAHPDDESFGLGALLDAFARSGAGVEVLCLTHGEASTLHGAPGDLASLRGTELAAAAEVLGVTRAMLKDHPDGNLRDLPAGMLAGRSRRFPSGWSFSMALVTPSTSAAAASSVPRSEARSPGAPCSVEASPWVRHSTSTPAPDRAKASRRAPRPNDSSSGWATTARTDVHTGRASARRLIRVMTSLLMVGSSIGRQPASPQYWRPQPHVLCESNLHTPIGIIGQGLRHRPPA